ncbi:MAG: acyltransferase [Rikenellaceae bacterium]
MIWEISTNEQFREAAIDLFRYQARRCKPYNDYLRLIGFDESRIESVEVVDQIPFLPIELFKSHDVYCGERSPEAVFTSSVDVSSRHLIYSLAQYERAFTRAFESFYGDIEQWSIYALLPSYLEREGSSLIYMVEKLLERCGRGGFYLYDHDKMLRDMEGDGRKKILLGVTYALLDLAESGRVSSPLSNTIVMETGGMKGRREEMTKVQLHEQLCRAFGVDEIASEYGMAELTSQAYSSGGNRFYAPAWMRVLVRDVADPFDIRMSGRGGVNIIDLASDQSCGFIQTQDMGMLYDDGSFSIDGRIASSDIRGCNLLID